MVFIIKLIILTLITCVIGWLISYGQGHVIILLAQYRIDISLVTVIIGIALLFIVCYTLIRLWVNTGEFLYKIQNFRSKHIPNNKVG